MCIASDFLSIGEVSFSVSLGRLDILRWFLIAQVEMVGASGIGRSIGRSICKSQQGQEMCL